VSTAESFSRRGVAIGRRRVRSEEFARALRALSRSR